VVHEANNDGKAPTPSLRPATGKASHRGRITTLMAAVLLTVGLAAMAAAPVKRAPERLPESTIDGPGSSYIAISIDDSNGQFTMGVPNGGPILLYGYPNPWSSFTSIKVDGTAYTNNEQLFGSTIQPPSNSGDSNEGIWQIGTTPLRVHQIITLVNGSSSGNPDTYLIQYKVDNMDTVSHTVGCRIMFDTDLDDNDGAPFQVPGVGSVTQEMQWDAADMPNYFFVFNDLNTPSVVCQGTLLGPQVGTFPDLFQIAAWPNIYNTDFDYTVVPADYITGDSAYAPYWLDRVIPAGQSMTFATYYGLGALILDQNPPVVSAFNAPSSLDCVSHEFSPSPFDISMVLSNSVPGISDTVTGITATLSLPTGLSLDSGTLAQAVPDLGPGDDHLVSWHVQANGSATGTLSYGIHIASDNYGSKDLSYGVYVPPGCPCTLTCSATAPTWSQTGDTLSFTGSASATQCLGTPSYAWNFGDGSSSTVQNPTHAYTHSGTYNWTLTVTQDSNTAVKTGSIQVVDPPAVSSMVKKGAPFRIIVNGSNLQNGIQVFINGTQWTTVTWKKTTKMIIGGGKSLKTVVPKGTPTLFRFVNPDGGHVEMTWSW
jgi:hypothetical protein